MHKPLRSYRRRHASHHSESLVTAFFNMVPLAWTISFVVGLVIGLNLH